MQDDDEGVPPSSVSLRLDAFSRGRRLLLSCSLIALDLSCPRSQSVTPDSRTQPCPRGTLIADQRGACAARPKGKNEKLPGGSLLLSRQLKFFPATGVARATPSFINLTFSSTTQPSLVLSWAPRKYRPPRPSFRPLSSPFVPHPPANLGCLLPRIAVT